MLPLLLALGWSEQLLAVEWKKIDLAAFWGDADNLEELYVGMRSKDSQSSAAEWAALLPAILDRAFNGEL